MMPATIARMIAFKLHLPMGGLRSGGKFGEPRLSRVRDSYLNLPSRWAPYSCRLGYLLMPGTIVSYKAKACTRLETRAPEVRSIGSSIRSFITHSAGTPKEQATCRWLN